MCIGGFIPRLVRQLDLKLCHTQPSSDLAGEAHKRKAVATHGCQNLLKGPGMVTIARPTVVPQSLVIREWKSNRLGRPPPLGYGQGPAAKVPSISGTVNPEKALCTVKPQVVGPQVDRNLGVTQVNRVLVQPAAIKQKWQYRKRFLWCVSAPANVVRPNVTGVPNTSVFFPCREDKDVLSPCDHARMIVVGAPALRPFRECISQRTCLLTATPFPFLSPRPTYELWYGGTSRRWPLVVSPGDPISLHQAARRSPLTHAINSACLCGTENAPLPNQESAPASRI